MSQAAADQSSRDPGVRLQLAGLTTQAAPTQTPAAAPLPGGPASPGYGSQPGYGAPPGYGGQGGYGAPPGYGAQQGYGMPPVSDPSAGGVPQGYGGQQGSPAGQLYGAPPAYGAPSPYSAPGAQPGYGGQQQQQGYGAAPSYAAPGYGGQPTYGAPQPGGQPSYGGQQQGYGGQPGYGAQPGSGGAPSYGGQPAYGGQPGMGGGSGAQPGFGGGPGPGQMGQQPGFAGPPGYGGAPGGTTGQGRAGIPPNLAAMERQDFGVPPSAQLHQGAMHGPTPSSIPGAQLVTTAELAAMLTAPNPPVLVDVLGGQPHPSLPGAIQAPTGGMAGSFNDQSQAQLVSALRQATGGDTSRPVVLFCLSPQCWLSYNATLRAKQAGYAQAMWYRGGLEAWAAAGLPMAPPGMNSAAR